MKRITSDQVKKVAQLARIELNEEEIQNHAEQLEKILDYINQLDKIDTENTPCTTRAIEVNNVFRTDQKKLYKNKEELLDLAPSREDDFFKVPKILQNLNVGDNLAAGDVSLPEGVELADAEDDSILITITVPRAVIEEEEDIEGLEGEEVEGEEGDESESSEETVEEESSDESGE